MPKPQEDFSEVLDGIEELACVLEDFASEHEDGMTIETHSGMHFVARSDVYGVLRSLYRLKTALQGDSVDIRCLADIDFDLALKSEAKDDTPLFEEVVDLLGVLPKKYWNKRTYEMMMISLINLFWNAEDDDGRSGQEFLYKALEYASKLLNYKRAPSGFQSYYIGRIFAEIADSDDSLGPAEKSDMFRYGIAYLQMSTDVDGTAADYYHLGDAQCDFTDHCMDIDERQELRRQAIENLRKSYDLYKDADTLDYIKEIEDSG